MILDFQHHLTLIHVPTVATLSRYPMKLRYDILAVKRYELCDSNALHQLFLNEWVESQLLKKII